MSERSIMKNKVKNELMVNSLQLGFELNTETETKKTKTSCGS